MNTVALGGREESEQSNEDDQTKKSNPGHSAKHRLPSVSRLGLWTGQLVPDISLGTVYRNLNVLRDSGHILELNYGSTYSRYDGHAENHYHFYCEKCHQLFNVKIPVYEGLDKLVKETTGFDVKNHRMEFYGLCNDCKASLSSSSSM